MHHFKIKIERYKANAIKKYCLENGLTLSRFVQLCIVNTFTDSQFKANVLDALDIKIPDKMFDMLMAIIPEKDVPLSPYLFFAINQALEQPDLLPKENEWHPFLNCLIGDNQDKQGEQRKIARRKNRRLSPPPHLRVK